MNLGRLPLLEAGEHGAEADDEDEEADDAVVDGHEGDDDEEGEGDAELEEDGGQDHHEAFHCVVDEGATWKEGNNSKRNCYSGRRIRPSRFLRLSLQKNDEYLHRKALQKEKPSSDVAFRTITESVDTCLIQRQ